MPLRGLTPADGETWIDVFTGDVTVGAGKIVTLYWDDAAGIFVR